MKYKAVKPKKSEFFVCTQCDLGDSHGGGCNATDEQKEVCMRENIIYKEVIPR